MTDAETTLRRARAAATALCLLAVVQALVLVMAPGVAAAMPPLMVLGLLLILLAPVLARWALGLVAARIARARAMPAPLLPALALMMAVPALFWGAGFLSRLAEALGAAGSASAPATVTALALAVLVSGLPAALSGWLALAFLRLGPVSRPAISHPSPRWTPNGAE